MSETDIAYIQGRRVWDSRGCPTVEADVLLECGAVGRGIAPAGVSLATAEAVALRDGGEAFGGLGVSQAVEHVNGEIAQALLGHDALDQETIDRQMHALDGTPGLSRLGANATLAVSIAVAHAAAAAEGEPLYRYLGGAEADTLPLPQVQIFGGGAHAGQRIDVQGVLVTCPAARNFAEALDWSAEIYRAAGALMEERTGPVGVADGGGWWPEFDSNEQALETTVAAIEKAGLKPGEEVSLALDIAASGFGANGHYRLARDGRELDSDGMIRLVSEWIARYPIASVEDPLASDDAAGFAALTREMGGRVQVVGDDFLAGTPDRIRAAARDGAANAVLLKPDQHGTLSETRAAWQAARTAGYAGIVSARSGESEDVTVVHLAVGWGVGQLKVGGFARGERMAKWNEALRIEGALGPVARFAGGGAFGRSPARG